jgi:hypothetical protein
LIRAAARDLNLDLAASILVGDQPSDIAAAHAAGIAEGRALLVGEAVPIDLVGLFGTLGAPKDRTVSRRVIGLRRAAAPAWFPRRREFPGNERFGLADSRASNSACGSTRLNTGSRHWQ